MFFPVYPERRVAKGFLQHGQGLVEYALILVLVAIVTIAVLLLLGQRIRDIFCGLNLRLGGNVSESVCPNPIIYCGGPGNYYEVTVFDAEGNTGPNISRVDFYRNGVYFWTEYTYHYCPGQGDAACQPFSLSSGQELRAVVYDQRGNSAECSVRAP